MLQRASFNEWPAAVWGTGPEQPRTKASSNSIPPAFCAASVGVGGVTACPKHSLASRCTSTPSTADSACTATAANRLHSRRCCTSIHSARASSANSFLHLMRPSQRRCRLSRLLCSAARAPAAAAANTSKHTCWQTHASAAAADPRTSRSHHTPRSRAHARTCEHLHELCIRLGKQLHRHLCGHAV